jgi:hypothetical protein
MASNAITSLGTVLTFNSNNIGEMQTHNGSRSTDIFTIASVDSEDNCKEKIAGLIDSGELSITVYYDGSNEGVYNDLNTDYLARTKATLLVTFSDTSSISCDAIISTLGDPNFGSAGEPHSVDVTFARSGKATYTDVAA